MKFDKVLRHRHYRHLFTDIRWIIQNACYCLFSSDLNKIFHIKDVYDVYLFLVEHPFEIDVLTLYYIKYVYM